MVLDSQGVNLLTGATRYGGTINSEKVNDVISILMCIDITYVRYNISYNQLKRSEWICFIVAIQLRLPFTLPIRI